MAAERLSLYTESVTKTLADGTKITARKIEPQMPEPGNTSLHESCHAVVAGEFNTVTIIPSGNALGSTEPVKMTAAAAAAAGAMGHDGTGWDRHITENVLGVAWNVAKSAARAYLAGKQKLVHAFATLLEMRETVGQSAMEEAKQIVEDDKNGIFPAEVEIQSPDGNVVSFPTKTLGGEIKISDLLPTPAKTTGEIIPFPAKSVGDEVKIPAEPAPLAKAA